MMFNRLPSGRLILFIMTEEQIKAMAEEYKAEYAPMYQKVVAIAFIDGMLAAMECMKKKLSEL